MKSPVVASFSLALLLFAQPSFAKSNDYSATTASELFGWSALALVATPVLLTASTGYMVGTIADAAVKTTVEGVSEAGKATGKIVKLVGQSGEALSELTGDAIESATDFTTSDSELKVEINKKEIPLKVRKDYLQLNQKVKTE